MRRLTIGAAFPFLLSILAACASVTPEDSETGARATPASVVVEAAAGAALIPPGDGLDAPAFRNLPPEARDYLGILSAAFNRKDKEFLISQGETQYERDTRRQFDDEAYLAMLYRVGPYSGNSEWMTPRTAGSALPSLHIPGTSGIEYSEWRENGPMLEINGRLRLTNSDTLPCTIMLVWRLPEPKILGERP